MSQKDDLISRAEAIKAIDAWDQQDLYLPIHFKQVLEELPSAHITNDVRQAKLLNAHPYGECSNCGYLIDIREEFNYCPMCGYKIEVSTNGTAD